MMSLKEDFSQLLALTQLHLLQYYGSKGTLTTDFQNYQYFKKLTIKQKPQQKKEISSSPPSPYSQKPIQGTKLAPVSSKPAIPLPQPVENRSHVPIQKEPLDHPPKAPQKTGKLKEFSPPVPNEIISKESGSFTLEPMITKSEMDLREIRQMISVNFPSQKIVDPLPYVYETKKAESLHKEPIPDVIILTFDESSEEKALLRNMANAIQGKLNVSAMPLSATELEKEVSWETLLHTKNLRLIITCSKSLTTIPNLQQYVKEFPKTGKFYAGRVPLCLLGDLSQYLKEPQRKGTLWNTIQELLRI